MLTRPSRETRIGILGLGDIGAVIGRAPALFDFQVSGWSRTRKDVAGRQKLCRAQANCRSFLAQCDILVCVLPLTPETEGIMNAKLFAQLAARRLGDQCGARRPLLIEEDLIAALDSGHLAGAVLDVFQTEPLPADSPIWTPSQDHRDAACRRHHRSAHGAAPMSWTA